MNCDAGGRGHDERGLGRESFRGSDPPHAVHPSRIASESSRIPVFRLGYQRGPRTVHVRIVHLQIDRSRGVRGKSGRIRVTPRGPAPGVPGRRGRARAGRPAPASGGTAPPAAAHPSRLGERERLGVREKGRENGGLPVRAGRARADLRSASRAACRGHVLCSSPPPPSFTRLLPPARLSHVPAQ